MATLIELGKFATVVNITLRYVRGGEIQPLSLELLENVVESAAVNGSTSCAFTLYTFELRPFAFSDWPDWLYKFRWVYVQVDVSDPF